MAMPPGICPSNHISGVFQNSPNFRYSLLLDHMPDQCAPVFELENMNDTTSVPFFVPFLLLFSVLPSFSKFY